MKISSNIKTGLGAGSQIQANPGVSVTPEILSPFATTQQQSLEEQLKKIDSQFDLYATNNYNLSPNIDYTQLNYTPLTDEEIAQYASDLLAEYKISSVNQINNSASRTAADLAASKTGVETAAQGKQQEIESYYDTAKQDSSNDALRRGLARSSIIVNKLNQLENSKAQAKTDIVQKLFDSIAEIDNKLSALETERLNALDDFDIVYAAKLGVEIEKQKQERQDRLDEVIKYNNTLQANQAQYGLDYAKTDSSLNKDVFNQTAEIADKDLVAKIQQSIYDQKYTVVSEYLYGMSASSACKDLEDRKSFYIEQLGKSGYEKMLVEQKSRK